MEDRKILQFSPLLPPSREDIESHASFSLTNALLDT